MLALVVAVVAGAEWCSLECFERAHPLTTHLGSGGHFGGPEVGYGFGGSVRFGAEVNILMVASELGVEVDTTGSLPVTVWAGLHVSQ